MDFGFACRAGADLGGNVRVDIFIYICVKVTVGISAGVDTDDPVNMFSNCYLEIFS